MKRTLITLLLFAGFLAGYCENLNPDTSGEMRPTNRRKYELIADIDIFQFKGEKLTPAQQTINKALKNIKTNILKDYYNEVEYFFDEDLSEIKNYKSEVSGTMLKYFHARLKPTNITTGPTVAIPILSV